MRHPNLTTLFAALALFGLTSSVVLWRELAVQRELVSSLTASSGSIQHQRRAELTGSQEMIPPQNNQLNSREVMPAAVAISMDSSGMAQDTTGLSSLWIVEEEYLDDPEYRRLWTEQMSLLIPQHYPDLVEALSLSEEETRQLAEVLAKAAVERSRSGFHRSSRPEAAFERESFQRELEASITSMIGPAGLQKWKDYEKSLPARHDVKALAGTMEAMRMPLRPDQRRNLTDAFIGEQDQLIPEVRSMLQEARMSGQLPDKTGIQELNLKRQIASNQRLLDVVATHLDARQFEAFKRQLDLQTARMRVGIRLARDSESTTSPH